MSVRNGRIVDFQLLPQRKKERIARLNKPRAKSLPSGDSPLCVQKETNLQPQWAGLIEDRRRSINAPLIKGVARTRASLRVALMRVLAG
jgi:hypothetical protein